MVDGVIEAPNGAHFTNCQPDYERDEAFQKEYAKAAGDPEAWTAFVETLPVRDRSRLPGGGGEPMSTDTTPAADASLAEICVAALADAFLGDGEIFASGMGTIPTLGARLARATTEPDLLVSDGEAFFVANDLPMGGADKLVEGWIPFRSVFDTLWGGRRHVIMGASQIDAYGNQNIANIGPWEKPKAQLLGVRGAPGNTINHTTSYWIPQPHHPGLRREGRHRLGHRLRPGRRARRVGPRAPRDPPGGHQPGRARLREPRPPHAAALGPPGRVGRRGGRAPPASSWSCPTTCPPPAPRPPTRCACCARCSTPEASGTRSCRPDAPRAAHPAASTCSAAGYPIVQTGMGWVAGPQAGVGDLQRRRLRHHRLGHHDLRRAGAGRGRGEAAHRRARSA